MHGARERIVPFKSDRMFRLCLFRYFKVDSNEKLDDLQQLLPNNCGTLHDGYAKGRAAPLEEWGECFKGIYGI